MRALVADHAGREVGAWGPASWRLLWRLCSCSTLDWTLPGQPATLRPGAPEPSGPQALAVCLLYSSSFFLMHCAGYTLRPSFVSRSLAAAAPTARPPPCYELSPLAPSAMFVTQREGGRRRVGSKLRHHPAAAVRQLASGTRGEPPARPPHLQQKAVYGGICPLCWTRCAPPNCRGGGRGRGGSAGRTYLCQRLMMPAPGTAAARRPARLDYRCPSKEMSLFRAYFVEKGVAGGAPHEIAESVGHGRARTATLPA